MPLLERGELLQREGVDPAELASARSAERSRLACSSRAYGTGSGACSPSATSPVKAADELVGPVVGDQCLHVEPELVERALLELLDPHALLGPGHLVAVDRADQLVELTAEVTQRLA